MAPKHPPLRLATRQDLGGILALVQALHLPTQGIVDHYRNFVVAKAQGEVIGVAGLELYGDAALLRSVAVRPAHQAEGLGGRLIHRILGEARRRGVKRVYLLTTDAAAYFIRFGFRPIPREAVAPAVQRSAEFQGACPQSAQAMEMTVPNSSHHGLTNQPGAVILLENISSPMEGEVEELSPKQRRILEFIETFKEGRDYPPTVRDIQKGCGLSSTSVVDYNLRALERLGYLRRDREVSRGMELLRGRRPASLRIPILGTIAAGEPIPVPTPDTWSTVDWAEALELTQEMSRGKAGLYALKVKGTSLVDALINDGDLVIMEPTTTAENGDLVAAWLKLEGETTLKRFYHEGDRVRLQPANSLMPPLYVDPENLEIQGRVIGVIRHL